MALYLIRGGKAKPGNKPVMQEPVVGRWYCEMQIVECQDPHDNYEWGEGLFKYEGDDCWSTEDAEDEDPKPRDFDYLQEQL